MLNPHRPSPYSLHRQKWGFGWNTTVDIPEEHRKKLERLASETHCNVNHECVRSGLEDLTQVEVAGDGRALLCLSEAAWQCHHGEPFGRAMLCTCPLRNYIAKHFGR